MTPAGNEHGYLALKIGRLLGNHVEDNELGRTYAAETGFKIAFAPDTVRAPDAAFVSRERVEEVGRVEGFWPGAPDLAVKVVSPGDTHAEVVEKSLAWLDAGCRMVLVAEPQRKVVTVYRSREDIRILTEDEAVDGTERWCPAGGCRSPRSSRNRDGETGPLAFYICLTTSTRKRVLRRMDEESVLW